MGTITYTGDPAREIKGSNLSVLHWTYKRGTSNTAYDLFLYCQENLYLNIEDLYKDVQEAYKNMGKQKARLRFHYTPELKYFEVCPNSKIFPTFIIKENE